MQDIRYLRPSAKREIRVEPKGIVCPNGVLPGPMSREEVQKVLSAISYKRDWQITLLDDGQIKIYKPVMDVNVHLPTHIEVIIPAHVVYHNEDHLIDVIGQFICDIEDHEFKEWFRYQNKSVIEPHPELVKT